MDGFAHSPRMDALFPEDFDGPEEAPEPEVIEPVFSVSELAAARDAAWQEGHAAGLQAATESEAAATRQALEAIGEQFVAEREAGAEWAEQSAESIARLLLDSLAATFPKLCASYGDAEVRAIMRAVLPALAREPAITVRAHPRTAATIRQEVERLDPELTERVHMVECDDMTPGDVRVAWRNGSAVRDAAALWQQVAEVLAPAGLLRTGAAIKEMIDGG